MAIAFIDGGTVDSATNITAYTLTLPAGTAAGDLFVLHMVTTLNTAPTFTPPSGAISLLAAQSGTTDAVTSVAWLWFAPSTPPASITVSLSTANQGTLAWMRFSGVDTTTPLNGTLQSTPQSSTSASSATALAVTTTVANTFIIGGINHGSSGTTATSPGWTIRADGTRRNGILATKGVQASAGSTGTAVWTTSAPQQNRVWQAALNPAASGPATPTLTRAVTGDPRSNGFTVNTQTANATSVRVKWGTNTAVTTGVVYTSSATPDADGYASCTTTGLTANTQYYYLVEMTNTTGGTVVVDSARAGAGKTLVTAGTPATFSVGFGSCHEPLSGTDTDVSYSRMRTRGVDLFLHLGDFHYADSLSTSQATHRGHLEVQMDTHAALKTLVAEVPTVYIKSDHDAGGGNDSIPGVWTAPNRAAYLQVFPTITRPNSNGLYGSLVVGRVRFIFTDTRYFSTQSTTPSARTRLGATQLAWFKSELSQPEPMKIWVQEATWIDNRTPSNPDDSWEYYGLERTDIANYWSASGVGKLIGIQGDQHALAADNGSHNSWGGFPIFAAAPFHNDASHKTASGPADWSAGIYPTTEGASVSQYGRIVFTDNGSTISAAFNGYDSSDVSRVNLTVATVSAAGSVPLSGSGTLDVSGGKNVTGSLGLSGSGTLAVAGGKNATGSASLSGSGTLGLAGGKNVAGSLGLSGSGTLGFTGSASQDLSGSIALSGSGTLGLIGSKSVTGSVALSGSGTLTTSGVPGWSRSLALSGSGTLGIAASGQTISASIGLSGSGTLGLVGGKNTTGALGLSGTGTLVGLGAFDIKQSRAFSGSGTLGLVGTGQTQSGSLALSGSGLLQPAGEGEQVGSGSFTGSGTGSLVLSGRASTSGAVSLSGSGSLTLAGSKTASGSAGFSGSGTLALVTVTLSTAGSRAFSGIGTLALSGAGSAEGSGAVLLSGVGSLAASGHATTVGSVFLGGAGSLALSGSGSGEGSGSITLSGTGNLVFSATEVEVSGSRALTGIGTLTLVGGASSGAGALELSGAGSLTLVGDDDGFEWPTVITLVGVKYCVTLTPVYDGHSRIVLEP